jgi:hypothetical protein
MSETPALLFFHHVPKTAGTSLVDVLRANYGAGLLELYDGPQIRDALSVQGEARRRALGISRETRCIASHSCEIVVPLLPANYQAMSVLRNPIERVISLYYYARSISESDPNHGGAAGRILIERGWSLDDLYDALGGATAGEKSSELHATFWDFFNGQARHLLRPYKPVARIPYQRGLPEKVRDFMTAFRGLLADRYGVGIQEEFETSVRVFAARYGWRQLTFPRKRRTEQRPKAREVAQATREKILEYNRLDMRLWREARQALAREAEKLGIELPPA